MRKNTELTEKFICTILTPLFTVLLVLTAFGQDANPTLATLEELTNELKTSPCKNEQRLEAARRLFEVMGATDADISLIASGGVKDLVVTKKGKTEDTVIVGAHYDKVADGCGAIDNWTGIVTVANLYRTFRNMQSDKTYVFVAFDKEESGLYGSNAFVKTIPKEKKDSYCWMVNIDSLGFSNPQVMDNTTTPKMLDEAVAMAKDLDAGFAHARLLNADADSSSFVRTGIPAITFHGLNSNWQRYLHTSNDKFENIKVPLVLNSYIFVLRYLAHLDKLGCSEFRKN